MAVFDRITGEITEMNTIGFKGVVYAIIVIRVQVVFGFAGTMTHTEIVLIVKDLQNILKRQYFSGIFYGGLDG